MDIAALPIRTVLHHQDVNQSTEAAHHLYLAKKSPLMALAEEIRDLRVLGANMETVARSTDGEI